VLRLAASPPQAGRGAGPPFDVPPPGPPPREGAVTGCVCLAPQGWGPTPPTGGPPSCPAGMWRPNPGPPPPDWGEEDYAVLPDLVQEACSGLGFASVRDAFATPNNRRFPGLSDQGRGRVRPGMGLPERLCPVGEPPVQPPRRGGNQGVAGGLPDVGRRFGLVRARVPVVEGPVRPLLQEVVLPRGEAGLPAWGHGPDAGPPVEDMEFLPGLSPLVSSWVWPHLRQLWRSP